LRCLCAASGLVSALNRSGQVLLMNLLKARSATAVASQRRCPMALLLTYRLGIAMTFLRYVTAG
jgi:hypothetical protein